MSDDEYYDTARSLYLTNCACGKVPKLTPDGNQFEIRCACGEVGSQGRTPAYAARNWNAKRLVDGAKTTA